MCFVWELLSYILRNNFKGEEMKQQKGILFAIWIGLLSALSGFVNITTLLLYEKPTTHMTGNVSGVLIHAMSGETSHALTLLLIIISFLLGGVCCGMIF